MICLKAGGRVMSFMSYVFDLMEALMLDAAPRSLTVLSVCLLTVAACTRTQSGGELTRPTSERLISWHRSARRLVLRGLLVLCALLMTSRFGFAADGERAHGAFASFTPPPDCQFSKELARTIGVSMACMQNFSPTHEFIVHLAEIYSTADNPSTRVTSDHAMSAVRDHFEQIVSKNREYSIGDRFEIVRQGWIKPDHRAQGADHCAILAFKMFTTSYRSEFAGEPFVQIANTLICAKADTQNNSISLVRLAVSERYLAFFEEPHESYGAKSRATLNSLRMK